MTVKGYFTIDVYDCTVHVIVAKNMLRSINYHCKKNNDVGLDCQPGAFMYCAGGEAITDYYLFFSNKELIVAHINHEKSHLVEQILKDRDIKPLDEVRSYLDGCVSRKLDLFFKKRKIKILNK